MLGGFLRAAIAAVLVALPAGAIVGRPSVLHTGARLFEGAFDPRRNFAGEITPSSMDEMILTVAASARDNYAPAYSLAIAHLCDPIEGGCRRRYVARVLRVSPDQGEWFGRSAAMVERVQRARSETDVRRALEASGLQWLEADVLTCERAVEAIDAVRRADWRPDLPSSLIPEGSGDLILHPAMIRVEMWGAYAQTSYRGWIASEGVPAAAQRLMERLEPCWRPSPTPPPWRRSLRGSRR